LAAIRNPAGTVAFSVPPVQATRRLKALMRNSRMRLPTCLLPAIAANRKSPSRHCSPAFFLGVVTLADQSDNLSNVTTRLAWRCAALTDACLRYTVEE
jgi:hypothetical protein